MTSEERHCLVTGEATQGEPDERGNYCGCDVCVIAYALRGKNALECQAPASEHRRAE